VAESGFPLLQCDFPVAIFWVIANADKNNSSPYLSTCAVFRFPPYGYMPKISFYHTSCTAVNYHDNKHTQFAFASDETLFLAQPALNLNPKIFS
jgi:hypothetical protein